LSRPDAATSPLPSTIGPFLIIVFKHGGPSGNSSLTFSFFLFTNKFSNSIFSKAINSYAFINFSIVKELPLSSIEL